MAAVPSSSSSSSLSSCSILPGYFYYTWDKNKHTNNSLGAYSNISTTADCCDMCAHTAGCEAFCQYHPPIPAAEGAGGGKQQHQDEGEGGKGLCRLYRVPLPLTVPGPGNDQYDSGNMHGPAPKMKPGPSPSPPGPHPPHPPPPPRPPPPPPPPPYNGLAYPTTTEEAAVVSSRLLHEALAPYLIVATDNTWFSYACTYYTGLYCTTSQPPS